MSTVSFPPLDQMAKITTPKESSLVLDNHFTKKQVFERIRLINQESPVTRLTIVKNKHLDFETFKELQPYAPTLISLNLEGCEGVTEAEFKTFLSLATKLESISLEGCAAFSDDALRAIFNLPSIKNVNLKTQIPREGYDHIILEYHALASDKQVNVQF